MRLFDWWIGLPWRLRLSVALAFLLLSTILWLDVPLLLGVSFPRRIVRSLAATGSVVGIALLLFSFPSKSERKGYHDF
jgi:hypothetical protein